MKPDRATAAKFAFNGVYRDNKHPKGYRVIAGGANKAGTGTVTLKDTLDGASLPDTNAQNLWYQSDKNAKLSNEVVAMVNEKDGSIRFPDGNVWRKEGGVVGVYIDGFAPYPKFRRLVLPGKDQTL